MKWTKYAFAPLALAMPFLMSAAAHAQQQSRPNIVVIWGDDIGQSDISAYSRGVMGFKTPTSTASPRKA